MASAARRIATISACAVGSRSARVRLPASATRSPSHTITQPIGTSPASAAARACANAISMKLRVRVSPIGDPVINVDVRQRRQVYTVCASLLLRAGHDDSINNCDHWPPIIELTADTMGTMPPQDDHAPSERIAKVIARAGLCSRREAESWIAAGRVAVNGKVVASPARNVTAADRVTVDGRPLPSRERTRLFLHHKPRGLLTSHADPGGRPTIFNALPKNLPRLISIGRLDVNTEGLLLLTNDGALARVLELPATAWLRR